MNDPRLGLPSASSFSLDALCSGRQQLLSELDDMPEVVDEDAARGGEVKRVRKRYLPLRPCVVCGNQYSPWEKGSTCCSLSCAAKLTPKKVKHGLHGSPEYAVWCGIKSRCSNPRASAYESYGARGIKVCEPWKLSFEIFIQDMGRRPCRGYSVERRDNNGNYEPSNCYWATKEQQSRNKRNNHFLAFNGETLTVSEWSRKIGVPVVRLIRRIKAGWSVERALTTPLLK